MIVEQYFKCDIKCDGTEDTGLSIRNAVDCLHKKINLYHYDVVVMPESRNRINQYMMRYIYRFNQPKLCNVEDILSIKKDEELCSSIRKKNVLVIDDATTSASTLNEILKNLRILNEDNEITIFSPAMTNDYVE